MTINDLTIDIKVDTSKAVNQINKMASALKNLQRILNGRWNNPFSNMTFPTIPRMPGGGGSGSGSASGAASSAKRVSSAFATLKKQAQGLFKHLTTIPRAFARIAFYRAIRSALKAIGDAFREGGENAYWFSKQFGESTKYISEALDAISSANFKATNQLGAAWVTLKAALAPIFISIIGMVTNLAARITELFAAINGKTVFLRAKDYTKEAYKNTAAGAKAAKEWKNQLMGFDVINRLEEPSSGGGGSGSSIPDYENMFEEAEVSESATKIAGKIKQMVQDIKDNLATIGLIGGFALMGLGAILAFSGANIPLGLGMMAAGGVMVYKSLPVVWGGLTQSIKDEIAKIAAIIGSSLLVIGIILLFSGQIGLGVGALVLGAASLGITAYAAKPGGGISTETRKQLALIRDIAVAGMLALGVILLCCGQIPMGIAMIVAAGGLGIASEKLNLGTPILDFIKKTWNNIKTWWNTNVAKIFTSQYWTDKFQKAINGLSNVHIKLPHLQVDWEPVASNNFLSKIFGFTSIPHLSVNWYANGGFPEDGLFMANHSELVGKFSNGKTAVANNEQITQGIARAVYDAFTSAMGDGRSDDKPIIIMLDGKEVARSTTKYQRQMARAGGV